jgi:hypothetical protein
MATVKRNLDIFPLPALFLCRVMVERYAPSCRFQPGKSKNPVSDDDDCKSTVKA